MVPWQSNSHLSGVADPPAGPAGENCTNSPMVNFVESLLLVFLLVFVVTPTQHVEKKRQQCISHTEDGKICDCSYFCGLRLLLAAVGLLSSWKAVQWVLPRCFCTLSSASISFSIQRPSEFLLRWTSGLAHQGCPHFLTSWTVTSSKSAFCKMFK